jgi:hypothetical protein
VPTSRSKTENTSPKSPNVNFLKKGQNAKKYGHIPSNTVTSISKSRMFPAASESLNIFFQGSCREFGLLDMLGPSSAGAGAA